MIQLAHGAGKRKCPSCVNGYDNAAKRRGGITNRNLVKFRVNPVQKNHDPHSRVHGQIVMNTVHQEMQHEEYWPIRKVVIDMEEEPVHRILEKSEEKVSKEVQRDCFSDSGS